MSGVRAHGAGPSKEAGRGKPGVLGIRREDKNKWERRAPVAPQHVAALVKQGIKVIVQPSSRRVFTDEEYRAAGAVLSEDLSECVAIAAVKEVPQKLLLPGRTYIFFSHTIKAQPAGMPLLDDVLAKKVRLVDYECITTTGQRGGPRLVAFGGFAGAAGAIDFLRGLGERFLALGYSTPLLHIGSAFMYPSLEEAKRAISLAGEAIIKHGLPKALCPFIAVFTGQGNVTQGALDIFKLLPFEMVDPNDLQKMREPGQSTDEECRKLYLTVTTAEHMVRHKYGGPFNKEQYYETPDQYEPTFQDNILPYSTIVINCMYWDARFPRLFTQEDIHRHVMQGSDRLLGVCDITCDADGSVPTRQFTSIEQPFFVYNALTESASACLDDPGVLFHAVDHLPSELPREASEHFGNCLLQYLPFLVAKHAPVKLGTGDTASWPAPIRGAVIAEGGELIREYQYISQLCKAYELSEEAEKQERGTGPHGVPLPPACASLEGVGHLFDSLFINKVCDLVESMQGRVQITSIEVGANTSETSKASMLVMAHDEKGLGKILDKIFSIAAASKVNVRRLGGELKQEAVDGKGKRRILVLGSGFVCGPLIEYLLRSQANALTVASIQREELEALAGRFGSRCQTQLMDVMSQDADMATLREDLVKSSDIIVSLVPASFHFGIAQLAVKHKKHMVTASYVDDRMQSLDEEAKKAGVLIINEVGLDPGIDHMSAMKMIHEATAKPGAKVVKFSSLCGGLPAPEVAGGNPLGYKFSWSPKGALLAARNSARWMQDGKVKEVPGPELLSSAEPITINNSLAFDVLPNRDSTAFAHLYNLASAPTFFRGTLRYRGFCERIHAIARLGLLELGPVEKLKGATTRRAWLAALLGCKAGAEPAALQQRLKGDAAMAEEFLGWLGLLSDAPLPAAVPATNPIDVLVALLQRDEMFYQRGERDMVAMYHELLVERGDGIMERRTATLIQYADPQGATAMARTVGLTAAIVTQLVLEGASAFGTGVQRPLTKAWYEPVLKRLEKEGIRMEERLEIVASASQHARL